MYRGNANKPAAAIERRETLRETGQKWGKKQKGEIERCESQER